MNYDEALEYIHSTYKFGSKLGLENIRHLLELMGNPQDKLKYVHVAGTNGKGSTVSFISTVLMKSGYRVGTFISPWIERFTERIRINGADISDEDLGRITEFVKSKIDVMLAQGRNHPTEFEVITAIGFQYYYEQKCDMVVLEVGLGGRFDATNIIKVPEVAVITTINMDHMEYLGDTLGKIAFEKAGIIKEGGDAVLYPQAEEARKVFWEVAAERGSRLAEVDLSSINLKESTVEVQRFDYGEYEDLKISIAGTHQVKNAATAVEALLVLKRKGYGITEENIREGLLETRWAGRFEILRKEPWFIIDGAHNPEGAKALRDAMEKYFSGKRKIFIVGVLKDKDYGKLLDEVLPLADSVFTVSPDTPRALSARELGVVCKNYCKNVYINDTIEIAVRKSLDMAAKEDVICSFGSLYYIGEVKMILNKLQGF